MYTTLGVISGAEDLVQASPVAVFDHFGGAEDALGVHRPGFADLVALVESGSFRQDLRRLPRVDATRPCGCETARANADCRQRGSHRLGQPLAASPHTLGG